jgi:hypothetical protein
MLNLCCDYLPVFWFPALLILDSAVLVLLRCFLLLYQLPVRLGILG